MKRPFHTFNLIFKACREDDIETARLLLKTGIDINKRNKHGSTPLHWACTYGSIALVRLLISHGADVNARDGQEDNNTALHQACGYSKVDHVRVLLEAGAETDVRDDHGKTPLDIAMELFEKNPAREEIIELFRQYAPELVMEAFCTQSPGGMR